MTQQEPASAASDSTPRILVAEDSSTMRAVACSLLQRAGFVVDEASDGVEAVHLAAARSYALILMDINMPTLDGVEAATMIRALGAPAAAVPILAMTAEKTPERLDDIRDAGMKGYLSKPFGKTQLLEAIAPWIAVAA